MTDKSAATQAVTLTDWDAFLAGLHADKLRQVRERLNSRVAVLTEFGADGLKMADEITRLRAELAAAQEVVRPFAEISPHLHGDPDRHHLIFTAYTRHGPIDLTVPHFRAAAEWLARQGVAG